MTVAKGCGCSLLETCPLCTFEPWPTSPAQASADVPGPTAPQAPGMDQEGTASEPGAAVIDFKTRRLTSVGSGSPTPRPGVEEAPRYSLLDCAKELVRRIEAGEIEADYTSMIIIPCTPPGAPIPACTSRPSLLGHDMDATTMLGKLEFAKLMLADWMLDNG